MECYAFHLLPTHCALTILCVLLYSVLWEMRVIVPLVMNVSQVVCLEPPFLRVPHKPIWYQQELQDSYAILLL